MACLVKELGLTKEYEQRDWFLSSFYDVCRRKSTSESFTYKKKSLADLKRDGM